MVLTRCRAMSSPSRSEQTRSRSSLHERRCDEPQNSVPPQHATVGSAASCLGNWPDVGSSGAALNLPSLVPMYESHGFNPAARLTRLQGVCSSRAMPSLRRTRQRLRDHGLTRLVKCMEHMLFLASTRPLFLTLIPPLQPRCKCRSSIVVRVASFRHRSCSSSRCHSRCSSR